MSTSSCVLRLADIKRSYQIGPVTTEVLRGFDLEIEAGDLLSVMGPSGSGKSTLMNIIGLLDQPTSGACFLNGRDVSKLGDDEISTLRNRYIGFVFQSFHLLANLTALENVCLPMVYRGMGSAEMKRRARSLLERVDMGDRMSHRPDQLSGGQKQRVAIARALVGEPALLLADEPTGALDPEMSDEVVNLLLQMNVERGVTVLIITHDPLVADQCTRQLHIQDGTLLETERTPPGTASPSPRIMQESARESAPAIPP
ncbi:MAG: ABC transporter ATP-binding protein [Proteobacteria bacterium]|nr:ABC transporter ATP-binding protein [Pseudomonadota bacterium]